MYQVQNVDFDDEKVFIIDDIKHLYIWNGKNASNDKKRFSQRRVKDLNDERKRPSEIVEMDQGKEFGSFLAIMDIMKSGANLRDNQYDRPELKIQYENTIELIEAGIDPDFEAKITLVAQELKSKGLSYKELCEKLAKIQLKMIKSNKKINKNDLDQKTKEIFNSSSTYDELCWLIAELEDLKGKKSFD